MAHGVDRYRRPAAADAQGRGGAARRARSASRAAVQRPVAHAARAPRRRRAAAPKPAFPAEPQENILYFVEKYSPKLEPWQRELVRIVRKLAQYFYPQAPDQGDERGLGDVLALHDPQSAAREGAGRRRLHARVPEEPHQRRLPAGLRLAGVQRHQSVRARLRDVRRHAPHLREARRRGPRVVSATSPAATGRRRSISRCATSRTSRSSRSTCRRG